MSFQSEEVNYLIYRYLQESGFSHSAFTFASEAKVDKIDVNPTDVIPGTLIYILQKGLQFVEVEAAITEDGGDAPPTVPVSLLTPYASLVHLSVPPGVRAPSSMNYESAPMSSSTGVSESGGGVRGSGGSSGGGGDGGSGGSGGGGDGSSGGGSGGNGGGVSDGAGGSGGVEGGDSVRSSGGGSSVSTSGSKKRSKETKGKGTAVAGVAGGAAAGGAEAGAGRGVSAKAKVKKEKKPASGSLKRSRDQSLSSNEKPAKARKTVPIPPSRCSTLVGHSGEVFCCAWNPTSPNIIASGSGDGTARVWNLGTAATGKSHGEEVSKTQTVLSHLNSGPSTEVSNKEVTSLDWNLSGEFLVSGNYDGVVRIWDREGHLIRSLEGHTGPIFSVKYSPDSTKLLTCSVDKTTIVWDASTGAKIQVYSIHTEPALDVDWGSNDMFASCSGDGTVHVFKLGVTDPLKSFLTHSSEVNAIRWSPKGKLLASCSDDCTAKVWNIHNERASAVLDLSAHTKEIYTISWSPDGSLLASASFDNTIRLWDVESGQCIHILDKHTEPVYSVAFSPDGKYLASGSFDTTMYIWSVADGSLLKSSKGTGGIFDVKWDAAGKRVAICFSSSPVVVVDVV